MPEIMSHLLVASPDAAVNSINCSALHLTRRSGLFIQCHKRINVSSLRCNGGENPDSKMVLNVISVCNEGSPDLLL